MKKKQRKGSMTVETALALPILIFFLLAIMQFASIQISSSALLSGMHETSKEMAVYAYVQNLGVSAGESLAGEIVTGGLSAGYAKSRILERAGENGRNGEFSLLQSSFTKNNMIDLTGSYRPTHTFTIFPVKKIRVCLRARVRAWTGREGASHSGENVAQEENQDHSDTVYVAETGKVYHKDPNCTHIRLSVECVSKSSISTRRNKNGGKYHACEICGASAGASVYISPQGDCYHSSLECSGLKRTVHECKESEVEGMRPCSRCGGG